ncbi:DUF4440 domain-containing protein [Bacillus sp. FJAT-27251]|uniref:nuclear transport factor 2 family protein n=1 Tax=Bacillus sp. FJAT-27251 TaxID=1684142 RepID=UPI0006A77542|nr:DUF4440 domain-containing protein [Bacillus sp. FJAT-27251]
MNFSLKDHLHMLEEKLLSPEVRASKKELTQLLSQEFFEIGSSGRMLYRDGIGEGGIGKVRMQLSEFEIHPLSDGIVLATYRIFNEITKQHSLRSSIWRLEGDTWKMVFHQGTKTEAQCQNP